jgi:glutathione S-transferase
MHLYIGNKNYSSWSLRAWLLLRQPGIDFEEVCLRMDMRADSPFKRALASVSPAGRVPVLVDDGFAVWDTLAIAEYLAERFPQHQLWPADRQARARARSLCAEMHSGFPALRTHCPMNIELAMPELATKLLATQPALQTDLLRIDAMWESALHEYGGPFLFGTSFTAGDAFYAPVCARIQTYGLPVGPAARAYVQHILALPAMRQWCDEARAEHDFLPENEPYRSART